MVSSFCKKSLQKNLKQKRKVSTELSLLFGPQQIITDIGRDFVVVNCDGDSEASTYRIGPDETDHTAFRLLSEYSKNKEHKQKQHYAIYSFLHQEHVAFIALPLL